jgi:phospholipid/cholesterol/gamma-HCH transport system substrate-binding protein
VTIQRATNELTATTKQTAAQINTTAGDFSTTAKQAGKLINNLDDLLTTNRSALVSTLNNINETSNQLRQTVNALSPAVTRLTQGDILKNLEILSANAAEASISLKDASKTLADPKNIVLLQQTLDAARVTFENTQKITSDLDELTGDPKFRQNLLQLVNGLNKLLSSTGDMQEQTKVALTLDSIKLSINQGSSQSQSETTSDLGVRNHGVKAEKLEKQENRVAPFVLTTPNPVIEITPVPELLPEPVLPSSQEP